MATPQAPLVTPSKPPVPVDISTIEAAKENIVPLHSGRSASQLAALSSSTRSGLGVKLDAEHARFASQIAAVETYEQTGSWEDGRDGLSADEVALLAEDPLDISHQYVRFIVANYPAGASASNKLVPVLEATTRKFLADGRYTNDPRYFRLWAHYAKNMENPEDCYRFLFAKGVGERLAALYEEYAKVLEAKHKRKQADQVYNLGINRRATPLDRLKRSYLDFQARMLVAPPVPSPPRASSTAPSSEARTILSSSTSRPAASAGTGTGTGVAPKGNGALFAVFRDDAGASAPGTDAEWDEFGTVKSRTRENNEEKKEWQGEVMPQKGAVAPKAGGFKLEVYRDETATAVPHPHALSQADHHDVFSRSQRPASEAELLRSNPFKNYAAADVDLVARDPLEGLEVVPAASASTSSATTSKARPAAVGEREKKERSSSSQARSKSSSKSSSSSKPSSSAPSGTSSTPSASGDKPKERVAVNLRLIYPSPSEEYSFEELRVRAARERYEVQEVERWGGWEWAQQWDEEVRRTGRTAYEIDAQTGWPVLFAKDGSPLYDFLPRPSPPTPEPEPTPQPIAAPPSPTPQTPIRNSQAPHSLLSPSPPRGSQPDLLASSPSCDRTRTEQSAPSRSPSPTPEPEYAPLDPHRPPSPTINTREANALLDHLFAKTLDFTKVNPRGSSLDSDDDDEPSTDEDDDDDDDDTPFKGVPNGGAAESQFSTQGETQQGETQEERFVPFSQTRSEMADDSGFYGSSQRPGTSFSVSSIGSQLPPLAEDSLLDSEHGDENALRSASQPLQLFRDGEAAQPAHGAVPSTPAGAFRPVTRTGSSARAPLGMKSGTPLASAPPPKQPLFSVFQDPSASGEVVPSSQPGESLPALGEEFFAEQDEFDVPLRGGGDDEEEEDDDDLPSRFPNDGYDLGRRLPGQSRYAPFVEQMTPIVERTLEFTAMTNLSASQRSRRDSYYPTGAAATAVQEEEEPTTEEEDDEDDEDAAQAGDQAFFAGASQPSVSVSMPSALGGGADGDDSSFQSGSSTSASSDDEDDLPPSHQQPMLPPSMNSPPPSAVSHFLESTAARSSPGDSRSFEVSLNSATLPEGLTIAGNQSGMTTNMLVGDLTRRSSAGPRPSDGLVVNPYTDNAIASILARRGEPIPSHPDVHDLRSHTANRLADLQRMAKKREKSKGGKDRTGVIDDAWDLELGGEVFSVREKLGEGAFGAVFRVALTGGDEDDFDVDAEDELSLAVKVVKPTNLWEFHVLEQVHQRLDDRARESIIAAQRLYAYQDESFLFLDCCDQGSLLDAVTRAQDSGVAPSVTGESAHGVDELLAMFFVVELLRIVDSLHAAGIVHGDLKIDNCLLRLEEVPGGARAWSSTYDASGSQGWSRKGLKLIDFGRSVDTRAFPAEQRFTAAFEADASDCAEMREKRPWTFEPDYFGVASVAFNVLFGRNIETRKEDGGRWALDHVWRRYYQVELWSRLFDMLLNPRSVREDCALPIRDELALVRKEMEEYLTNNGEKAGRSLKGLIRKLEIYSMSR
ncbi:hypothetical protein JCM10207_003619 [Rhodosporidiobolus poonsookiae]